MHFVRYLFECALGRNATRLTRVHYINTVYIKPSENQFELVK